LPDICLLGSSPSKKRGIVIRSASELEEISKLLTNPKMLELTELIDGVNPIEIKSKAKNADNSDIYRDIDVIPKTQIT
jgi:hypothetical protein